MSLNVPQWLLMTLFVVGALFILFYGTYLTRYRRDLRPGQSLFSGRSWSPEWNLLNPNNYDARGRALLKWLYLVFLLQGAVVVCWVMGFEGF